MAEMPRPMPMPSSAQHDRHDPLLVAQLVGGDPLGQDERDAAAALAAACPDCALLAADLRSLSSLVADEPVPPRRRDFRIPPARAEQLRGGALQRLLRRFTLPQAAALRPVAAGVMSLGLVLVVAGNVWPETTTPEADPAPAALESSATAPAPTPPDTSAEMSAPRGDSDDGLQSDTVADGGARLGEAGEEAADAAAARTNATKTDAAAPPRPAAEGGMEAPAATSLADAFSQTVELEAMTGPADAPAADEPGADRAPADVPGGDRAAADGPTVDDPATTQAAEELARPAADGIAIPTLLLVVGSVLAVGGLALLVLIWAARRVTADPLLR